MLKSSFILVLFLISFSAFSQEEQPKHMVVFGNDFAAAWSGKAGTADVDSSLGIDKYDLSEGKIQLNYAYRLAPQFQLGLDFTNSMEGSEVKAKAGGKIKSEDYYTSLVLFGVINFSERLNDSFYLVGGYGKGWNKDISKDSTGGTVEETRLEYDQNIFYVGFGKRFNLKFAGIENLTYSPSISYQHSKISGDLEDQGVNSISVVSLDIIKFDLLF